MLTASEAHQMRAFADKTHAVTHGMPLSSAWYSSVLDFLSALAGAEPAAALVAVGTPLRLGRCGSSALLGTTDCAREGGARAQDVVDAVR